MPLSPAVLAAPAPDVRGERRLGLSANVIATFVGISLLGFLTTNPLLTVASLAVLPFIIALTWQPGEPPALTFVAGFHWLQATMKVFHANALGIPVSELRLERGLGVPTDVETASWLSLIGVLVMAVGMWAVIRRLSLPDESELLQKARRFSISRTFWLYLAVTFAVTGLYGSVGGMSGLRQILYGAAQLRWAAYFLLGFLVLVRKEGYPFFLAAFAVEFISGIGFFSGFKEVFFVTAMTYFTARSRITAGTVVKGTVAVVVLVVVGSAWTVVKHDYRTTISSGEGQSGGLVSQQEQISILFDRVSNLSRADLAEGFEPLALRITYVDYFGFALRYVPEIIPHQDGAQWAAAVKHVLTPRILFPDKPALISDSEVTKNFTGLYVAGEGEGTSISIGYFGESYIDFGRFGMMIPILLVGMLRGGMYWFFLRSRENLLVGYAFATALVMSGYQLEKATAKMLGGVVMKFAVLAFVFVLVAPRVLAWLQADESGDVGDRVPLPARRAWA